MYVRIVNNKIGEFIGANKYNFVSIYEEKDFDIAEDFLEIIEKYSTYEYISIEDFNFIMRMY